MASATTAPTNTTTTSHLYVTPKYPTPHHYHTSTTTASGNSNTTRTSHHGHVHGHSHHYHVSSTTTSSNTKTVMPPTPTSATGGSHRSHLPSPSPLINPKLFQVIHHHTTSRSRCADEVKDHARIAEFLTIVVFFLWHRELFPKKSSPTTSNHPAGGPNGRDKYTENQNRRLQFQKFTENIVRSARLSYASIMIALKYIHRFVTYNPDLRGEEGSELRLFISSLIVANKYLEDHYYSKKAWMQVCHFTKEELNIMELEFLSAIRFNLSVGEKDYEGWLEWVMVFMQRLEVYVRKGEGQSGQGQGQQVSPPPTAGVCQSPMGHGHPHQVHPGRGGDATVDKSGLPTPTSAGPSPPTTKDFIHAPYVPLQTLSHQQQPPHQPHPSYHHHPSVVAQAR